MGKYQYRLKCEFKVDPESFISVADELEISIPCINCQRDHRTIVFENITEKGICTPRKKCNGFPGKLTSRELIKKSDHIQVNYLIDFEYEPFIDQKYNVKSNFKFGWTRVYFTLNCSNCEKENTISTQENVGRPWDVKCDCGNVIYKDHKSPFSYKVIEVN
ncbi:hypothetical protein SAMN04487910_4631 [Aquimarina amphilecti]|uniref:Uncharacterized protein n=1 Tax=Aquimarina amphilecti TaxID=1038014 RepID=A0A1H7X6C5_AQUAM|nr:hypothetical protein [Aquimarina amphilecti]SEM28737.1 hypothetical protein SAMN04487910_4631 [Aquimarina amphilecti]